ncbi:MAG: TetR/AcrR family transcriptional regulator [Candidatus Binatia bacterium]
MRTETDDRGGERPGRRSRRTRGELLQAARAVLEQDGLAALTVKAVTERADVGHGTFYHHFPSTEALLAAAIGESMRELSEAMQAGFADADDKAWVFVASLTSTFRMLAAHPALGWMLERPHLLATSLRETCGPFARRDLDAMIAAGDVPADGLGRAARYWEWIIVGALVDAAAHPADVRRIEESLLGLILRVVGLDAARVSTLIARSRKDGIADAAAKKGGATTNTRTANADVVPEKRAGRPARTKA